MNQICHTFTPNGHELSPRNQLFKNNDNNMQLTELRRRRNETVVQLRKQKRDDHIEKRRHIYDNFTFHNWSQDAEQENQLSVQQIISVLKSSAIHEIAVKHISQAIRLISNQIETSHVSGLCLINQFLTEDVITKLIGCLVNEQHSIALLNEILTLIALLSSGGKEQTSILVKAELVPNLITLLSHHNHRVVGKTVIALANISSSSAQMRDLVMNSQFLRQLLPLTVSETYVNSSEYTDDHVFMVRAISLAVFTMCQHQDMNSYKNAEYLLPYLVKLLDYQDNDVKAHVLRALSTTTDRNPLLPENHNSPILRVVQLVASNIPLLTTIISDLSPQNNDVVFYAIRIIANIVSWAKSYAQIIIQAGALTKFNHLINHQKASVQKEVTFTISNITAGGSAQIQAVIDANIVPSVVELLYLADYKTQLEATHVILNISAIGSMNQLSYLINIDDKIACMNVFDAMATMLTSTDAEAVEAALHVYNNLLLFAKRANVINKATNKCQTTAAVYHIDSLQQHNNSQIAALATHIMDEYFTLDCSLEED